MPSSQQQAQWKKVTTTKTTVTSLEIKGLAVDYNKYIRLSHFEIIFFNEQIKSWKIWVRLLDQHGRPWPKKNQQNKSKYKLKWKKKKK